MFKKEYLEFRKVKFGFVNLALYAIIATTNIAAQSSIGGQNIQSDGFNWWTIILFLLVGCLIIAVFFRYKTKNAEELSGTSYKGPSPPNNKTGKNSSSDDKELEWLRKNRKIPGQNELQRNSKLNKEKLNQNGSRKPHSLSIENPDEVSTVLPIFSFLKLKPIKPFDALPLSNDEALMSAIEQVHEEFEEDEEIRALAVRILAAFRTSNSVESLSQVALYDLSSNLRSTAVTTLSEFDHESVFETILLACADPTREVRAAAARALFHLTFNRADAWTRIANSGEQGKMLQISRAAIEADLVERSFERLIHKDRKYSYEAFALVILLIRSGEMEIILNFLQKSNDSKLRRAILHTIKVSKEKEALDGLISLLKQKSLSPELQEDVDKTIEEMGFVTA
jgi:hypothetical protein